MVNGETVYLRGTLILGCGDNPAANLMSGFKSLTSAFRKCRSCMATASDFQTKVSLGTRLVYMHTTGMQQVIMYIYVYSFMKVKSH